MKVTVLKLGGELIESPADLARTSDAIATLVASLRGEGEALAIVHGGGRAIDAALASRGIAPRKQDGIRLTDASTLEVVVDVLAGRANTTLVAALSARGIRAVGLTGADAGLGLSTRVESMPADGGAMVDPGLVGQPAPGADATLVRDLARAGYVPVIASIGTDASGALLNVNADVMAAHVAAAAGAVRLILAGGTAGVLDAAGTTIPELDAAAIDAIVADGTATAGMIAKLNAARAAVTAGVPDVRIVSGLDGRFAQGTSLAPRAFATQAASA